MLAIIGVLSVGAISGYQKAMLKYKLNIWTSGLNYMLFNMYDLHRDIYDFSNARISFFVPKEFIDQENGALNFYDKFQNYWGINAQGLYVRFGGKQNNQDAATLMKLCPRFLEAAKEIAVFRLVIAYPKESITICNETSCMMDYASMTVEKTHAFCQKLVQEENKDSIFYIRSTHPK